jgi:two-component system OmpR family response regulator
MRILVVEDQPDLLSVLAQALREAGYAVDTASDGKEGLFKAETDQYDTVVLDLMMPLMDGWTVLKKLRDGGHRVPVLILTARDSLKDRVRGLDCGADDYLIKPFELAELLARIRALVRRAAGKADSVIHVGDVTVDTTAHTVIQAGQSVSLTPREYAIVQWLAVHQGELITRTTLYDHLFDEEDDSLSNLLDVHISNIRRKLGSDFIITRRGHGYMVGQPPTASEAEHVKPEGGGDV